MTRNHDRPPIDNDRYTLAETAKRLGTIMGHAKTRPLIWAQEMHNQWEAGVLRPRRDTDAKNEAKLRGGVTPALIAQALKSVVKGENEQRLRSLIRAVRLLSGSASKSDQKMGASLATFLREVWRVDLASEVVAEGEVEAMEKLREEWGDAQLPPAGATVNQWVADELLISAAVRRLG